MSNSPDSRPRADLKERTFQFAVAVIRLFKEIPGTPVGQVIGKQMLRSGTSVGANYREANRARSRAEFVAKMGDCLKEIEETEYWLELLALEEILPQQRLSSIRDEAGQLAAILITIINNTKQNLRQSTIEEAPAAYEAGFSVSEFLVTEDFSHPPIDPDSNPS